MHGTHKSVCVRQHSYLNNIPDQARQAVQNLIEFYLRARRDSLSREYSSSICIRRNQIRNPLTTITTTRQTKNEVKTTNLYSLDTHFDNQLCEYTRVTLNGSPYFSLICHDSYFSIKESARRKATLKVAGGRIGQQFRVYKP